MFSSVYVRAYTLGLFLVVTILLTCVYVSPPTLSAENIFLKLQKVRLFRDFNAIDQTFWGIICYKGKKLFFNPNLIAHIYTLYITLFSLFFYRRFFKWFSSHNGDRVGMREG